MKELIKPLNIVLLVIVLLLTVIFVIVPFIHDMSVLRDTKTHLIEKYGEELGKTKINRLYYDDDSFAKIYVVTVFNRISKNEEYKAYVDIERGEACYYDSKQLFKAESMLQRQITKELGYECTFSYIDITSCPGLYFFEKRGEHVPKALGAFLKDNDDIFEYLKLEKASVDISITKSNAMTEADKSTIEDLVCKMSAGRTIRISLFTNEEKTFDKADAWALYEVKSQLAGYCDASYTDSEMES